VQGGERAAGDCSRPPARLATSFAADAARGPMDRAGAWRAACSPPPAHGGMDSKLYQSARREPRDCSRGRARR